MRATHALCLTLSFAGSALLADCDTVGYCFQPVNGHSPLMVQRESIDQAIDNARQAHNSKLAKRLEDMRSVRIYTSYGLGLPDDDSHRIYANLERSFAAQNVFAAPELSVKLKEWCFLIVGCVTYREHYDRNVAMAYADTLRAQGLDVDMTGIPAYSTLDYFDDPLLNTLVGLPEDELVRLIFHELAHQVVYTKNDTALDKSLVTIVETIGVEYWLADAATSRIRAEYTTYDARCVQFRALLLEYHSRLETLYANPVSDDERRAGKRAILASLQVDYAKLKASWGSYTGYDRWFAQPLPNAHLGAITSYPERAPVFTTLYHHDSGDWTRLYDDIKAMAWKSKLQCEVALQLLAPPAVVTSNGITRKRYQRRFLHQFRAGQAG